MLIIAIIQGDGIEEEEEKWSDERENAQCTVDRS